MSAQSLKTPAILLPHAWVPSGSARAACAVRPAYQLQRRRGRLQSVIGQRPKQPGMHWAVNGADSIISLRCAQASSQRESHLQ